LWQIHGNIYYFATFGQGRPPTSNGQFEKSVLALTLKSRSHGIPCTAGALTRTHRRSVWTPSFLPTLLRYIRRLVALFGFKGPRGAAWSG
jgi:hypothetical protein